MGRAYICAMCKEECWTDEGWTDEDAKAEMESHFGKNLAPEDVAVVCEDCYKKIDPALHPHLVETEIKNYLEGRRIDEH